MKKLSFTLAVIAISFILFSYLSPKGWHAAGTAEDKYDMGTIRYGGHDSSKSCGTVKSNKSHYFGDEYGLLMQTFSAQKYQGKKIRMTGYMKTRNVEGHACFMLRADKENGKEPLTFDNMADRKITGTTNWLQYKIELDIPANASRIAFGGILHGAGQIWIDDISFEVIGNAAIAADSVAADPLLPKEPVNLDFEQ